MLLILFFFFSSDSEPERAGTEQMNECDWTFNPSVGYNYGEPHIFLFFLSLFSMFFVDVVDSFSLFFIQTLNQSVLGQSK